MKTWQEVASDFQHSLYHGKGGQSQVALVCCLFYFTWQRLCLYSIVATGMDVDRQKSKQTEYGNSEEKRLKRK